MNRVRKPAVAGLFHPGDPRALEAQVDALLANVRPTEANAPPAIIALHAGYIYSGPIAASVYAELKPAHDRISRVGLLGPAHRVAFNGLARAEADYFETPLGRVPVDADALARIAALPQVVTLDRAHAGEHSLEVHLPFLQRLFADFRLVPLVVGHAGPVEVGEVIERLWNRADSRSRPNKSYWPSCVRASTV